MNSETFIESLPCALTAQEKLLKTDQLVEVLAQVTELEEAKKEAASSIKEQIQKKERESHKLAHELRTGHELRPIECIERPRYADLMVDKVRVDTGAVVSSRAMHPSEQQTTFDLDRSLMPIVDAPAHLEPANDNAANASSANDVHVRRTPSEARKRRIAGKKRGAVDEAAH